MRYSTPVVAVIALGLAAFMGAAIVIFALNNQPPAPSVTYRFGMIESNQSLSHGETLMYRQEITIRDTPVQLRVADSFWSVDNERTMLADTEPEFRNYTTPVTVHIDGAAVVPPLTPGEYEFRESATGESWRTAVFGVRFTVRTGCE